MARVMIVDDAEFMRMVIKDTLLKHGHEVVAEVGDGEEAIQKYLEVKPDIVLMDIIMPDMDGKEALQKLLTVDPEAKIVMCSSLGQQALITESMKIGAMGFIVKPFEPAFTVKENPFRISFPSIDACKLCILSIVIFYFLALHSLVLIHQFFVAIHHNLQKYYFE